MARRKGWGGTPPANDDEARAMIVAAAARCLSSGDPAAFNLSHVAEELGVARPTVYRYFDGTEALFHAVSAVAAERFGEKQARHLQPIDDPLDWAVEAVAYAIERLPREPLLLLLLRAGRAEGFAPGFTSTEAMSINHHLFAHSTIDWDATIGRDGQRELEEIMLRVTQSMLLSPPVPARRGAALRAFLRRWLASAVHPSDERASGPTGRSRTRERV